MILLSGSGKRNAKIYILIPYAENCGALYWPIHQPLGYQSIKENCQQQLSSWHVWLTSPGKNFSRTIWVATGGGHNSHSALLASTDLWIISFTNVAKMKQHQQLCEEHHMFWLSAKVVICNMDTKSKKKKKE